MSLGIRVNGAERAVVECWVENALGSQILLLGVHSTSNSKHVVCLIILKCEKGRVCILMVILIVVNVIEIRFLLSKFSFSYSS